MRLQQPPIHLVVICFAFAANVHRSKTLRLSNDRNAQQDVPAACAARELWPPYFSETSRARCDTAVFDIKLVRRKDTSFENRERHRESKENRCDLELNSKTTGRQVAAPAESRLKTVDSRNRRFSNMIMHDQRDSRFNTKERLDQNFLVRDCATSKRNEIMSSRYFENILRQNDLTATDSERSARISGNRRRENIRAFEPQLRSENNRRQDSQRHLSLRRIDNELLEKELPVESTTRKEQQSERSDNKRRQNQIQERFRITTERRPSNEVSGTDSRGNGDRKMRTFQRAAQIRGLDSRTDARKINGRMNLQEIGRRSRLEENSQRFERRTEKARIEEIRNSDRRNSQRFEQRAYNLRTEENRMGDRRNGQSIEQRIANSRMDERTRRIINRRHSDEWIELQNGNARVEEIRTNERRIDPRTQQRTNIVDQQESTVGSRRNNERVEQRERNTRVDERKNSERIDGQRFKRQTESPNMEERRTSSRINDRRVEQRIDSRRMEQRRITERRHVQRSDRIHENKKLEESSVDNRRNNQRRSGMEGNNEKFRLDERRNERGMTANSRSQERSIHLQSRPSELQKAMSRDREQRRSSENRRNSDDKTSGDDVTDTTNSKREIRITPARNSMPNRIIERRQLLSINSMNREMRLQSDPRSIERKSQLVDRRRSLTDSIFRDVRTQSSSRSLELRRSLTDSINREVRMQSRSIERESQFLKQQRYLTDSVNREQRTDSRYVERKSRSLEQQRSSSSSINREVQTQSISRSIERQSRSLDQQRSLADSRTRLLDRQQSRSLLCKDRHALMEYMEREIRKQSGSVLGEQPTRYFTGSLDRQLQTDSRSFERQSRSLEQRRTLTDSMDRQMRGQLRSVERQSRSVERRLSLTDSMVREVRSQSRSIPAERQSRSLVANSFAEDVRADSRSQSIDRQSRSLEQRRFLKDDIVRKVRMQTQSSLMDQQSRSVEQQRFMTDKMKRNVRTQSRSKSTEWPSQSVEQQHSLRDTINREVRMQSRSRSTERKSRSVEQERSLIDVINRDVRMQFRSSSNERQSRSERRHSGTDAVIREVRIKSYSRSIKRQSGSLEQQLSLEDSLRHKLSTPLKPKSRSLQHGRSLKYSVNRNVRMQSHSRSIKKIPHSFEQRRSMRDATNSAVRQEHTKSIVQLQSKTLAERGPMKSSSTQIELVLPIAAVTSMVSEKNSTEMTENRSFTEGEQTSERNILKRLALLHPVMTFLKIANTFVQNWLKFNTMDMKDFLYRDLEGIIGFSSKKMTQFTENHERASTINGHKLRISFPEPTMLPWTTTILALTLLIQPMGKQIKT